MIVYHGTDSKSADSIINEGIDLEYGEKSVDNGQGFYMTPNFEFAKERAKIAVSTHKEFFADSENIKPAVIEFEILIPSSNMDICVKEFTGVTYEWKEFVFYNRIGYRFMRKWGIDTSNHNLDGKYDIVIDETADRHLNSMVSRFMYAKNISSLQEEIAKIGKPDVDVYWDKQVSVHSENALKYVKFMNIVM